MKKTQGPIISIVLLVLAIVIATGGVYFYSKNKSKVIVSDTTSSSQVYRNEKYGFELTFPKTWGEVTAKENGDEIWFASSNSEKGSIFYISAMTEQKWKDCQESAKTGIPSCAMNALTRNSTTIFNWGSGLQDPYPQQEARLGEVQEILSSFKFTK